MASDFLRFQQDPSLGNAFSSIVTDIGNAPGKALSNTHTVEEILALRAKQKRDQEEFDQQTLAGNAAAAAIAGVGPRMSTRDVQFQPQGPVNPADPVDPNAVKLGDQMVLPSYASTEQYVDPKVKAQYDRELPMFQAGARAEARKNVGGIPGFYSRAAIGLGGAPTDPAEMQRLSGMTTGTVTPLKGEPFVAKSQDGKTVAILGMSPDGGIHTMDGRLMKDIAPPGSVPVQAGVATIADKPHSIFENEGTRMQAITDGNNAIMAGKPPDPATTRNLSIAIRQQFPEINKLMPDAVGNTTEFRNYVEKEAPPEIQPLLRHIYNTLPEFKQPQAAAAVPGAAPATAGAVVQQATPTLPGTRPATGPQPNILVNQPATQFQNHLGFAVQRADTERQHIVSMIFNGQPIPPSGMLPKDAYLPDWKAALIAENHPDGLISRQLMNAVDPKAQEYYAAAKAWIEPVLRLASGAAIRTEEYKDYMYMFIPMTGDSQQLVAQKLNRMREWQEATGGNATANQATATLIAKANANKDPEMARLASMMQIRAREAKTADIPATQLPAVAPKATGGPVTPGAGGPNPAAVQSLMNTIRGGGGGGAETGGL